MFIRASVKKYISLKARVTFVFDRLASAVKLQNGVDYHGLKETKNHQFEES